MRMSDWSSDVCSSDLAPVELETVQLLRPPRDAWQKTAPACGKGIIKVRQKNAGNIADHLRVQEIILHEPLDRRFTLPLGKAHPCRDLLLQIEGQPVLGPSGDAMQMAADGPEKILRPLKLPQFAWREESNVDKFRHRTTAMHIFADPEHGLQIATPPRPFLPMELDDIAAVAYPFMPLRPARNSPGATH